MSLQPVGWGFGADRIEALKPESLQVKEMVLVQQFDHDLELALSTLGAGTVIRKESLIDGSRLNGFRLVKSRIFITMTGKTTAEGPILFGLDIGFPAGTDVKAVLETDPQSSMADQNRGKNTFLKILGVVGLVPTVFPASDEGITPAVYEMTYGKNGWSIPEGQALNYWFQNLMGSALTTGTTMQITAEHFGVWLRD